MAENEGLFVTLGANTSEFTEGIESSIGTLTNFSSKMGEVIEALEGPAGLAAVAAAVAIAIVTSLSNLGQQWDEISTDMIRKTGATGDALQDMQTQLKSAMSEGVTQGPEELGSAMDFLTQRLHLTGIELKNTIELLSEYSDVTGTKVAEDTKNITEIMARWNLTTQDMPTLLDQLTKASQLSGVGVSELSTELTTNAVRFQDLGLSLTESIGLLAGFGEAGIKTETVTRGLNTAIATFAKDGIDAKEGFAAVIESIKDSGSAADASALAIKVFGARAGPEMASAIQTGKFNLDQWNEALKNASGTLTKTGEDSQTVGEKLSITGNKASSAFAPAGQALNQFEKDNLDVLNTLGPLAAAFNYAFADLPVILSRVASASKESTSQEVQDINNLSAKYNALPPLIAETLARSDSAIMQFNELVAKNTTAILIKSASDMTVGIAGLPSQYQKIVAQQGASALATIADTKKNLDSVLSKLEDPKQAESLAKAQAAFLDQYNKKATDDNLDKLEVEKNQQLAKARELGVGLEQVEKYYDDEITKARTKKYDAEIKQYQADFKKKQDLNKSFLDTIEEQWDVYFNGLKTKQTDWSGVFSTAMTESQNVASTAFAVLGQGLAGQGIAWNNLGDAAKKSLASVVQGIGAQLAAMAAADAVKAAASLIQFNPVAAAQFGVSAGLEGAGAVAAYASAAGIAALAVGTPNWKGGVAMVGEQGPELVNLPKGSQVFNNQQTSTMTKKSANQTINITSPIPMDRRQLGVQLRQIQRQLAVGL